VEQTEGDGLVVRYADLLLGTARLGPLLDLACGDCHNGLYLAERGATAVCCDGSSEALAKARLLALASGTSARFWQVDLESEGPSPLPEDFFGAIVVFRYLHRPLIEPLRHAIKAGGLLVYETFTVEQRKFGRPRNPDHLLEAGELGRWFQDWEILHSFEGTLSDPPPPRAVAQLVCRKPAGPPR
jgi:hypothetical protein